jgi:hypothetical protein
MAVQELTEKAGRPAKHPPRRLLLHSLNIVVSDNPLTKIELPLFVRTTSISKRREYLFAKETKHWKHLSPILLVLVCDLLITPLHSSLLFLRATIRRQDLLCVLVNLGS